MKKSAYIPIFCMLLAFISGCSSSAPCHYYMLSSTARITETPQANYSVSVGPVSVPAIVDRQQMVLRTGPNQVFVDEYERWASPLKDEIGSVVVEDLISILGTKNVTRFPQSTVVGSTYRAAIDILRFDSELGKVTTLDALWTVSSVKGGQSFRGRTTISETAQGDSYAALVAGHSLALGRLSADIAKTIQDFEVKKP